MVKNEPKSDAAVRLHELLTKAGEGELPRVNRYHAKRCVSEFEVRMIDERMFVIRARTVLRKAKQLPADLEATDLDD